MSHIHVETKFRDQCGPIQRVLLAIPIINQIRETTKNYAIIAHEKLISEHLCAHFTLIQFNIKELRITNYANELMVDGFACNGYRLSICTY